MTIFNIEDWARKDQYYFFLDYDDPIFGITANVDVTELHEYCKSEGLSFFLASLFCSTRAVNQIENFRMRIQSKEEIYLYDMVHPGSTILLDNQTFTYANFEMKEDLHSFCEKGKQTIEGHKSSKIFESKQNEDLIYYSVIPWTSFTAIKHPRKKNPFFSIPQITFGKYFKQGDRLLMPVSVEGNHALMDGYHMGKYFEYFKEEILLVKR